MTAKSKPAARDITHDSSESSADPREDSGIRQRTARRREELLDEVQTLRRAGKIREAKGIEGRAQQVEQLLGALESEGGGSRTQVFLKLASVSTFLAGAAAIPD